MEAHCRRPVHCAQGTHRRSSGLRFLCQRPDAGHLRRRQDGQGGSEGSASAKRVPGKRCGTKGRYLGCTALSGKSASCFMSSPCHSSYLRKQTPLDMHVVFSVFAMTPLSPICRCGQFLNSTSSAPSVDTKIGSAAANSRQMPVWQSRAATITLCECGM